MSTNGIRIGKVESREVDEVCEGATIKGVGVSNLDGIVRGITKIDY